MIDSEDEDDRTRALKRAGLYNPNGAARAHSSFTRHLKSDLYTAAPAVASSSKVKLEDSCRPLATTVKLENSAPPVASSSKVKLEDTPMVIHSDEEEYMDDITRARLRTRRALSWRLSLMLLTAGQASQCRRHRSRSTAMKRR